MRRVKSWSQILIVMAAAIAVSATVNGAVYAETTFYVASDGSISVQGTSNHPQLAPGMYENLTSSSNGVAVFSVSINDSFSDYLFTVDLPGVVSSSALKAQHRHVSFPEIEGFASKAWRRTSPSPSA